MNGEPLVDREYLLEKCPETGGWTHTVIPEIAPDPHAPFGMVKVRGTIDGMPISDYSLMPGVKGSGVVFMSVKADLRRKIGKEAGDTVHITLWRDDEPLEVPEEFLACLADDADALRFFRSLLESEQRQWVRWIYTAKTEQTRVDRIARAVRTLAGGRRFGDR